MPFQRSSFLHIILYIVFNMYYFLVVASNYSIQYFIVWSCFLQTGNVSVKNMCVWSEQLSGNGFEGVNIPFLFKMPTSELASCADQSSIAEDHATGLAIKAGGFSLNSRSNPDIDTSKSYNSCSEEPVKIFNKLQVWPPFLHHGNHKAGFHCCVYDVLYSITICRYIC